MSCFRQFLSKLKVPVIAAPMAGGFNNPVFAAAVINNGGIGSFGFSYSSPAKIKQDILETQKAIMGPINANFFIFAEPVEPPLIKCLSASYALENILRFDFPGVPVKLPTKPYFPSLSEQLEPIWETKPSILSFHFGMPPSSVLQKAKNLGIFVGITATNVRDAIAIRDFGADFVVAQGKEAGGHRGEFQHDSIKPDNVARVLYYDRDLAVLDLLSTRELVVAINEAFRQSNHSIPIIASGGIMTPKDVRSFMKMPNNNLHQQANPTSLVQAVQMGTAFLTCQECTATPGHKRLLLARKHGTTYRDTVYTNAFSGKFAHGLHNRYIDLMTDEVILPFPLQNTMTGDMRRAAVEADNPEFQSLWCGANYLQCEETTVHCLMSNIAKELHR